jgi:hypothetical protein
MCKFKYSGRIWLNLKWETVDDKSNLKQIQCEGVAQIRAAQDKD